MKIITFSAIKGGVGKTTLAFNLGEYLANLNHKILFIDLDHQCNLTTIYASIRNKNNVSEIFKPESMKEPVDIIPVTNNIDLISGDVTLDSIENDISTKTGKEMLLFLYLNSIKEKLKKYDYIIIDTHPDFTAITKNAIAISDYILSPITPSQHGYEARFNISSRFNIYRKELIDYKTGQSLIDAKLYFIANMVKHNTNSSFELLEAIKEDPEVIAVIPHKELFNKSTLEKKSIASMKEDSTIYTKNQEFFNSIDENFDKIKQIINK